MLRSKALSAILSATVCVSGWAQNLTFEAQNGQNVAYCGPPGAGIVVSHSFQTPESVHDTIAVEDEGGIVPPTSATSTLDAAPSSTGIVLAEFGTAQRGAPTGFGAYATADARDSWRFSLATATPFSLSVRISMSNSETQAASVTFGFIVFSQGRIDLADGSSAGGFSNFLTDTGEWAETYTGTLQPGRYEIWMTGRTEGALSPFLGSFANTLQLHVGSCTPADANGDGAVDLSDLTGLLAHFGMSGGASNADGDVDGDGDIDLADLTGLLSAFGETCS